MKNLLTFIDKILNPIQGKYDYPFMTTSDLDLKLKIPEMPYKYIVVKRCIEETEKGLKYQIIYTLRWFKF